MNFWFFKTHLVCLIVYAYIAFCYFREHSTSDPERGRAYIFLFLCAFANLALDITTVYSINHQADVSDFANRVYHFLFFESFMLYELLLFRYFCLLCGEKLTRKAHIILSSPFFIGSAATLLTMDKLLMKQGEITAFSAGIPVYIVSVVIAFYFFSATFIFVSKRRYILSRNYKLLLFSTGTTIAGLFIQLVFEEALFSSIIIALMNLVLYQIIESGIYEKGKIRQRELSHIVADIVESRDIDTGGHVKRTSAYVELIAKKLRASRHYAFILNEDYIEALMLAAPLHDVGKIAIPDAVLQKPDRLTREEYEIMKIHAEKGALLLEQSISDENKLFKRLLCETSHYHHEKWNGKGYPEGLSGQSIPLCARIMAVADVFDAVSQDRCYRPAMTMDESFNIIAQGSGQDFDPTISACFLENRPLVEQIYAAYTE